MILRIATAILRAILLIAVLLIPSLILKNVGSDSRQITAFVALILAAIILVDYGAASASLIPFRFIAPINRLAFGLISLLLLGLSLIVSGRFADLANLWGKVMNFPYSPVHAMTLVLQSAEGEDLLRNAAGFAHSFVWIFIIGFGVYLRRCNFSKSETPFSLALNLPTFEASSDDEAIQKLSKEYRLNLILGFLLPFFIPVGLSFLTHNAGPLTLSSDYALVWGVALWALVPAGLIMRGLVLARIVRLLKSERRRAGSGRSSYSMA